MTMLRHEYDDVIQSDISHNQAVMLSQQEMGGHCVEMH
jgi:hypothetical protein